MIYQRQAMQAAAAATGLALFGRGAQAAPPSQQWHISVARKYQQQGTALRAERLDAAAYLCLYVKNSIAWPRVGYPEWMNVCFLSYYGLDIREIRNYDPRRARPFIYTWDVLSQ